MILTKSVYSILQEEISRETDIGDSSSTDDHGVYNKQIESNSLFYLEAAIFQCGIMVKAITFYSYRPERAS